MAKDKKTDEAATTTTSGDDEDEADFKAFISQVDLAQQTAKQARQSIKAAARISEKL